MLILANFCGRLKTLTHKCADLPPIFGRQTLLNETVEEVCPAVPSGVVVNEGVQRVHYHFQTTGVEGFMHTLYLR